MTTSVRFLSHHTILFCSLVLAAFPMVAQPTANPTPSFDDEDRAAIIDDISSALHETYIFADTARAMGEHLADRLSRGAYEELSDPVAFTTTLTEDLQSVSRDLHLRVRYDQSNRPTAEPDPEERARRQARYEARSREDNYCFKKVEQLDGNIGLIELGCFAPAELGGPTAVAAMKFLAHTDALIFDLTVNGGGSPSMIQLLTSYLVAEPTHLNSFYIRRTDETQQFWTAAHIDGEARPEVPVFVLVSGRTFSAAEEFSYNLRNLDRATLVGETTGGGAHPVQTHWVDGYPVRMSLPYGRAINPITGTNWEGTGVEPHLEVPAAEALDVAYAAALETVIENSEEPKKSQLAFLAESLRLRKEQFDPAAGDLEAYVGTFGSRVIRLEHGRLTYQRNRGVVRPLIAVGEGLFLIGETNTFRLRFEHDDDGTISRVVGLYQDGREEPSERSDD